MELPSVNGLQQFLRCPYNIDDLANLTDLLNNSSILPEYMKVTCSISELLNSSGGLNIELIYKFKRNLRIEGIPLIVTLLAYSLLIVFGAAGNSLVMIAVIRNPSMRTARNVFIINLAASDLFLCLATTPLTMVELLTQYWPLGNTPFLCKLVGTLQATSIFVSVISITAIALDRYQVKNCSFLFKVFAFNFTAMQLLFKFNCYTRNV